MKARIIQFGRFALMVAAVCVFIELRRQYIPLPWDSARTPEKVAPVPLQDREWVKNSRLPAFKKVAESGSILLGSSLLADPKAKPAPPISPTDIAERFVPLLTPGAADSPTLPLGGPVLFQSEPAPVKSEPSTPEEEVKQLIKALEEKGDLDPERQMADAAREAIERKPGTVTLQVHQSFEVARLGNLGSAAAAAAEPLLVILESHRHESLRAQAAEALGRIGDPRALDGLANAARFGMSELTRNNALAALERISPTRRFLVVYERPLTIAAAAAAVGLIWAVRSWFAGRRKPAA